MTQQTHARANPTRKKILTAAKTVFAKAGYAGAAMAKIAKLAEVNHSLIFHHFTNKAGLWDAVKQNIVAQMTGGIAVPSTELPFDEFVQQSLNNTVHFFKKNRDVLALIHWQRVEGQEEAMTNAIGVLDCWVAAFSYYQRRGLVQSELEPEFMATFMLSIAMAAVLGQVADTLSLEAYLKFSAERIVQAFSQKFR